MTNLQIAQEILDSINEKFENMSYTDRSKFIKAMECNFNAKRYDRFTDVYFEYVNILNSILFKNVLDEFKQLINVEKLNPRPWLISYLSFKNTRI